MTTAVNTHTPLTTLTDGTVRVSGHTGAGWSRPNRAVVSILLEDADRTIVLTAEEAQRLGVAILAATRHAHLAERAANAAAHLGVEAVA
jgi:hypothetical protein